ncbi:MAG: PEPxxWA-CTERM sorting domain-containing protein [Polymorphobacter sp.]|uniref:PEPxxWA-CTERM sorting domain-containing protein n=1 Tax=Polymorphobacter sp. TaxID=1909290 RepID=UPI003A846E70
MKLIHAVAASLMLAAVPLPSSVAHATLVISQTLIFDSDFAAGPGPTDSDLTFTGGLQTLEFQKFDTLGGRLMLTDVIIDWTPSVSAQFRFQGGQGSTAGATALVASTLSANTGAPFPIPVEFTRTTSGLINNPQGVFGINVFRTTNFGFVADQLGSFIGAGTIEVVNSLQRVATTDTSGLSGEGFATGSIGGTLNINYFYLDPIPEPGSWAMLIAGFGLIGAAQRRRRSRVKHAA